MAGIPQVITEDRASGAQFIDGSLRFDSSKGYCLKRTFTSNGKQRAWTWSGWVKRGDIPTTNVAQSLMGAYSDGNNRDVIRINGEAQDKLSYQNGVGSGYQSSTTSAVLRDTGWYHLVISVDLQLGEQTARSKIYVNGILQSASNAHGNGRDSRINGNYLHFLGARSTDGNPSAEWDGEMSQCYFIDGLQLGPGYFGFTDPLTGTWRPKKFKAEGTTINDGRTWSDNTTGTWDPTYVRTRLFDGNFSTQAYAASGTNAAAITFSDITITQTNRLRVYGASGWSNEHSITSNGVTKTWNTSNSTVWSDLTDLFPTPWSFDSINATYNGNLRAIEVGGTILQDGVTQNLQFGANGFYLPMDGNSPIGEDKSGVVTPNDGTVWSDFSTASNINGGNVAGFFQGDTSSCSSLNLGTSGVFLLTKDIPNVTKIGVHSNTGASFTMKVNEGLSDAYTVTVPSQNNVSILDEFTGFTGTIHTLSFSGFGAGVCLNAIEINGVLLVDGVKGNDWTPVKFGGSVELSKATGVVPILNTNEAGTVAKRGVRTDKKTYTVTASGGNYYLDGALKPTLNAYRGGTYTFDYTGATSHPFYLSSLSDGKHNSKAYSSRLYRSGGYLDLGTGHTDLQPGSGDFCIELYANLVNQGANFPVFVDTRVSGSTDANGFFWGIRDADNRLYLYTHGGIRIYADHYLTTGKWYHLALTRKSGTFRMFIDGSQVGVSYSQSQNYTNQIRYIGNSTNSESQTWYIDAYISNFRFVKGEAVYTTNFTPPQTTLTTTSQGVNSSNVKLLCCQDSSPTTAVVSPGTITLGQAGSDAVTSVNTHNPFLYNSVHGNFGVNTGTSNTTKITIPHWAADTLYYYCSAHSGMGSSINVTTDVLKADPYAWKNVLAMPLHGSSVDYSGDINVGTTSKSVTNNNGPSYITTLSNFYTGSGDFSGTSTQKKIDITTSGGDFGFGMGDFTIEYWIYATRNSTTNAYVWDTTGQRSSLIRKTNGGMTFETLGSTGAIGEVYILSGGSYGLNKWLHWAVVRSGDSVRVYLDGVLTQTTSGFGEVNFGDVDGFISGYHSGNAAYNADAFLQDFRIYKGLAKYNENFVVGSTDPNVLPDSPSGITSKTNLTKITDGAVTGFESNSDYLSVAGSNDFVFDGDHTIELFVYHRTLSDDSVPWCTGGSGQPDQIYIGTNGICNYGYGQTGVVSAPAGTIVVNRWQHIAVSKQGTNLRLFVDGKIVASSTNHSSSVGRSSNDARIGNRIDGGNAVRGFISNLRIVKGTALYTSEFTPPTEPLTNVTNTVLLCCQSTTSAVAAAVAPGSITANGDAVATNFNPFTDDINTIRGQESGYATMNPIGKTKSEYFVQDGNLTCGNSSAPSGSSGSRGYVPSTIGFKTGKLYAECVTFRASDGDVDFAIGIFSQGAAGYYQNNGTTYNCRPDAKLCSPGGLTQTYGTAWADGDIIGIAVDLDSSPKTIQWFKNGIATGTAVTISTDHEFFFGYGADGGGGGRTYTAKWNFGQKPFKFPPPDGFQPLNLSNVQPEKVIARPDQYVGVSLWSGNGTSQSITGLNHKPDLVWIKKRAGGSARSHQLFDSVRGVYKTLHSDSANAEDSNTNRLTAFNQDGFAVGGDDGANGSSGTFVGWTWKAGGDKNTFNIDDVGYANASDVNMSVGALNSVTFDKSQNWTSQITGTQNSSYPFSNMFNADGQATHAYPANGTRATFTPSPSFSNAKTVKVWYYAPSINADTFQLNGVNVGDQMTTTGGTLTKTFNVDGFTSWSWSKGIGGDDSGMLRIDVDGVQLVDSGVSTPNTPSIAATGSSVGTKQGFSIIKYTSNGTQGATIAHGLTQKPDFAIFKNIDSTLGTNEVDWGVYHSALGATKNLELNQSLAEGTNSGPFNNTEPTSSVFTFGGSPNAFGHSYLTNGPSGDDFIAYIWHDVPGLQKFGSYINPSSTVGAFVELGFKPAVIIYKCARNISSSSGAGDWMIIDTTRSPVNRDDDNNNLVANVNNAEDDYYTASQGSVDILSNGFKIRHNNSSPGGDPGRLYIYAAWAEAPGMNLYGSQSNAR